MRLPHDYEVPRLPRLNEPAPNFEAHTTHGRRSLEDYCGKWLVLFSHPADFTPVCTSEFVGFSRAYPDFLALGCELIGLSVDSTYSHIAWLRNIEERFGVEVPFPIIEDGNKEVASAYGMIHPGESDTSAVRATFVIDGDGILRAMLYYPMTTGRSVNEVLRLVRALVTSAAHRVATPEGWKEGDAVVMLPPGTVTEARERAANPESARDWYYSERKLES